MRQVGICKNISYRLSSKKVITIIRLRSLWENNMVIEILRIFTIFWLISQEPYITDGQNFLKT